MLQASHTCSLGPPESLSGKPDVMADAVGPKTAGEDDGAGPDPEGSVAVDVAGTDPNPCPVTNLCTADPDPGAGCTGPGPSPSPVADAVADEARADGLAT